PVPEAWTLAAVGDVDADGDDDIIWRHCNGQVRYWEMQDGLNLAGMDLGTPTPSDWTLAGAGDVDGDRDDDIIWQDQAGQVFYWEVEDGQRLNDVNIDVAAAEDWSISGIGDLDGDADDDIVWQHHDDIVDYGTVRASQFKQYEKTADNGKNAKCTWYIMRGSSEASLASADQIQFDAYAFGIPSLFLDHHNHIWTAGLVKFDFPIPTYTVVLEWQALVNVVLPQGVIISDDDDSVILDLVVREQTQSVSFPRSLDDIEDDEWIYTNPRIYYDNESTNTRRPREERLVLSGEFIVGGGEATSLIIGPSMLISSDKSSWASIGSEKDRADDGIFYFNGLDHDCLLKSSCTRTGLEVYYTMRPYYVHVGPISLVGIPR
ncbi:MAG: hypothetical protein H6644_22315, partial [Caldilineaceae bacterium]|nr:hypothetical protein [Caldilineaceae bacterium]